MNKCIATAAILCLSAGFGINVQSSKATASPARQVYFGGIAPAATDGPLVLFEGPTSHPDRIEAQVGEQAETNGQFGIVVHYFRSFDSSWKNVSLNLTTGTISIAESQHSAHPMSTVIYAPPAGGNYFAYMTALTELRGLILKVRLGNHLVPVSSAAQPSLEETLRYIDFISSSLSESAIEAVFADGPSQVRPAGSYAVTVFYKTSVTRDVAVEFVCGTDVIASSQSLAGPGTGTKIVSIDLPAVLPASCTDNSVLSLKLLVEGAVAPDGVIAKFTNQIKVVPSNLIEDVFTRGSTELSDKAFWLKVSYALSAEGTLHVTLVRRGTPGAVLLEQEYPLTAGDHMSQEVLMMLPDEIKASLAGDEQILLKITDKDGNTVANYMLYASNARA